MRDKLDNIRFYFNEFLYTLQLRIEGLPDWTKRVSIASLVIMWFGLCTFLFINSRMYELPDIPERVTITTDVASETLTKAYELQDEEKYSEAFELLATHKNKFSDAYDSEEMERLERLLVSLGKDAPEADIAELYSMKDLVEQQPIYSFVGVVSEVDEDAMYGVTHTVSADGQRALEQLEVIGLVDATVGAYVSFVGVPRFDDVSSPIKVQAFVMPSEDESQADGEKDEEGVE